MIDKERLKRLVKRVKRIPEAGNGGEALLFLLQGNVKRAWPQEQPHAGLRDMVSSRRGQSRGHPVPQTPPIISELS
jgi:hypothetical protein